MITKSRIIDLISMASGADTEIIKPETTLTELSLDSLDKVELIMAIESECNLSIPDDEAEKLQTIQDIFTYLENKYCLQ